MSYRIGSTLSKLLTKPCTNHLPVLLHYQSYDSAALIIVEKVYFFIITKKTNFSEFCAQNSINITYGNTLKKDLIKKIEIIKKDCKWQCGLYSVLNRKIYE